MFPVVHKSVRFCTLMCHVAFVKRRKSGIYKFWHVIRIILMTTNEQFIEISHKHIQSNHFQFDAVGFLWGEFINDFC